MPPPNSRLLHLHLPNPIPYTHSLRLQEAALNRHWIYRQAVRSLQSIPTATASNSVSLSIAQPHHPPPILLTFSTLPTYTVGRRHLADNPISESQIAFLTGASTRSTNSSSHYPSTTPPSHSANASFTPPPSAEAAADFHPSPRGGLLTYHAPGQLTAYPIIDLRRYSLSARAYISLLESSVIATCASLGLPNVGRSPTDPGVWVLAKSTNSKVGGGEVTDRKICAVGVRVTRGVSSHGVGLNVFDAPIPTALKHLYTFQDPNGRPFPLPTAPSSPVAGAQEHGYLSWGFGRITACGLPGKSTTWLTRELSMTSTSKNEKNLDVQTVATVFAQNVLAALNKAAGMKHVEPKDSYMEEAVLSGVEQVTEEEVLRWSDELTSSWKD